MLITFQDVVIGVLCFIGIFTSTVYIVTILSQKKKRHSYDSKFRPKISVIIPVWNEGSNNGERIRKTLDSVLNARYPKDKLEIIVVNDGSTDNSLEIIREYKKFGVKIFSHKKSKGKTQAVNLGISHATGELIMGLDADSFIMPDVFEKIVPVFKDKRVMAAMPSVKIWQPKSLLQKIQFQEFLSSVFVLHIQSSLGGVPLVSGACTVIRKSFIDKHGAYSKDTMVEDLEMALRIQSHHYRIEHVVSANVYTSGVNSLKAFINQRLRWFYGFIVQMKKYKHMFSSKYGDLGFFILPLSVFYIFLNTFVFSYTLFRIVRNLIKWVREVSLVGISFKHLFEFSFDPFLITIKNTTVLPVVLLLVLGAFMYYIKIISEEKQEIFLPFIAFTLTYWILGPICWVLAIYYYISGKTVKWGPNYFAS
ncbi:MAG: glycosyltransferase family 2 protein [Candidatus Woesearchaeota archaeon]